MNWTRVLILAALLLFVSFFEKKSTRFSQIFNLAVNVVASALFPALSGLMGYGIYKMVNRPISLYDKIEYCVTAGICILALMGLLIFMWRDWFRKRKAKKETNTEE